VLAGSFALFAFAFLLFLKLFPVIAIAEVKELEIHEREHPKGDWEHLHTYGETH